MQWPSRQVIMMFDLTVRAHIITWSVHQGIWVKRVLTVLQWHDNHWSIVAFLWFSVKSLHIGKKGTMQILWRSNQGWEIDMVVDFSFAPTYQHR
jgi:hypothetical protein